MLDILLSECPKGCTLTIWADEQMVRRLDPFSTHVAIAVDDLNLPAGIADVRALYVCFHAPGCQYSEVSVKY